MIAFVFPGQGSQTPTLFAHADAALAATLAEANEVLGYDVRAAYERASGERDTALVQIALLVAGVASVRTLADVGITPDIVAGHSVGAFGAAVAARAIAFADAVRVVAARGAAMRDAYPTGYGMGAVVGLQQPAIERLVAAAACDDLLEIAVVNAPTQIVVAGALVALERFLAEARARGAASARLLDVAVPSHTSAFARTGATLRAAFASLAVVRPTIPIVLGSTARRTRDPQAIATDLFDGAASRVLWSEALAVAVESGVRLFVAMRPGEIVRDLAMRAYPDIRALAVDGAIADVVVAARGTMHGGR